MTQYDAQNEHIRLSDRAAVDISLVALRSAIIINGGAVLALLAFVGQLWDDQDPLITGLFNVSIWFLCGLISGVFAGAIAYFYQSHHTRLLEIRRDGLSAEESKVSRRRNRLLWWMIALGLLSPGLFLAGSVHTIFVLNTPSSQCSVPAPDTNDRFLGYVCSL